MSYTSGEVIIRLKDSHWLTISRPFADAVRAGVGAIMCSYNQINNSYACQNSYTMNHILKGELDFQGFGKLTIGFIHEYLLILNSHE
jgi:hypothetical protein